MIYLDNNATTRPLESVVEAVRDAMTVRWHNPSSIHRPGQEARRVVELARRAVAELIGARPAEITFTSGGTEALGIAIRGALAAGRKKGRCGIVTSLIEHAAIRDLLDLLARDGVEVALLPLDRAGVIDASAASELIDDSTALVVCQWANNETGAIQPIEAIGAACRERGVPFLCDGAQWVGKMPTDVEALPVDMLAFAAHKFHGPKGAGALWQRRGVRLPPLHPGAQEQGRRGGTENVPAIAGFGAAATSAGEWLTEPEARRAGAALRDRFEAAILKQVEGAVVNGPRDPEARLWNTTDIGFPRLEAEALLMQFSERGLCASAGAACSSGSLDPSPVLIAMGVPTEVAHGSIRFSLSRESSQEEVDEAVRIVAESVERLRASMASLT